VATDNYLKIAAIKGDSKVDGHADEIELQSWSMGVSVPVGARSSSGSGSAGTSMHADVSCMKTLDAASNDIAAACWTGATIPNAVITVQRQGESGGGKVDYMKLTLGNVIISTYQRSGGDSSVPMEQFSMNYDKIKTEYFTTGSGGESDGWQSKAWSVAEEKEI